MTAALMAAAVTMRAAAEPATSARGTVMTARGAVHNHGRTALIATRASTYRGMTRYGGSTFVATMTAATSAQVSTTAKPTESAAGAPPSGSGASLSRRRRVVAASKARKTPKAPRVGQWNRLSESRGAGA